MGAGDAFVTPNPAHRTASPSPSAFGSGAPAASAGRGIGMQRSASLGARSLAGDMRRIASLLTVSPQPSVTTTSAGVAVVTEPVAAGDFSAGPRPAWGQAHPPVNPRYVPPEKAPANHQEVNQLVERVSAVLTSLLRQHDNDARLAERRFQQLERSLAGLRENVTVGLEWREKWAEVQGSVSGVIEESQMLARRVETLDERLWSKISGLDLAKQRGQDLENQVRAVEQQGRLAVASLEGAQKRQAAKLWRSERAVEDLTRRVAQAEEALRWWATDGQTLPAADAAGGCGGPGTSAALTLLGGSPQELLRDLTGQVSNLSQRASRGEATIASLQSQVERLHFQAQEVEGGGAQQAAEVSGLAERLRSVETWLEDDSARRHRGDHVAAEQVDGLESRIQSAEGWLEELSQRGPEWDGQIASLRDRLNGMESWLGDAQGWTAQITADVGAQMAAEVGDLRERRAELLEASGSVQQLAEQVNGLEAGVRQQGAELQALGEQASSLNGSLKSCQHEILETSLIVKTLSEQSGAVRNDFREHHSELARTRESLQALSEQAAVLDGDLKASQQEARQVSHTMACLAQNASVLDGEARERQEQLASMDNAVAALSEHVALLDSNFRGCQRELVEAGETIRSLAQQAAVLDSGLQEHQAVALGAGLRDQQLELLETGLREHQGELRETSGSLQTLQNRVAELEASSRQHREGMSSASGDVEALADKVAALERGSQSHSDEREKATGSMDALAARVSALDSCFKDLAGKVTSMGEGSQEQDGRLKETAALVTSLSAKIVALHSTSEETREDLAESSGAVRSLSAKVAALGDDVQGCRSASLEAGGAAEALSSRVASLEDGVRGCRSAADEASGSVEALSSRVAGLEALPADVATLRADIERQGQEVGHAKASDGLQELSADVASLRADVERQAQEVTRAHAGGGLQELSADVASLRADFERQAQEVARVQAGGGLQELSADVIALRADQAKGTDGMQALSAEVATLRIDVERLAQEAVQAKAGDGLQMLAADFAALRADIEREALEAAEGRTQAGESVRTLSADVVALRADVQGQAQEAAQAKVADGLEALSADVAKLRADVERQAQEAAQAKVADGLEALSADVATLRADVERQAQEVDGTGAGLEKQVGGLDARISERHQELSDQLERSKCNLQDLAERFDRSQEELLERLQELSDRVEHTHPRSPERTGEPDPVGAVGALSERVSALDGLLEEQGKELSEARESVRSLVQHVEDIQAQLIAPQPSALGLLGGAEGLGSLDLEALEDALAESGVTEERAEQALGRLQATCQQASQAVAAAARRELAACLQPADQSCEDSALGGEEESFQLLDARGLLQLQLGELKERFGLDASAASGEEGAGDTPLRSSREAGADVDQEGGADSTILADEGEDSALLGIAIDQAADAEKVDEALARLHAVCLEAAQGIASAARGELCKLELAPAAGALVAAVAAGPHSAC